MNRILHRYQAKAVTESIRERMEYMDQWINPLHQSLIDLVFTWRKCLGLIAKYVQDIVDGFAALELSSEPVS